MIVQLKFMCYSWFSLKYNVAAKQNVPAMMKCGTSICHADIKFPVIFMACMDQLAQRLGRFIYLVLFFGIPDHPPICSIQYVLSNIDNCIQYGEDADVKVRDFIPEEDG